MPKVELCGICTFFFIDHRITRSHLYESADPVLRKGKLSYLVYWTRNEIQMVGAKLKGLGRHYIYKLLNLVACFLTLYNVWNLKIEREARRKREKGDWRRIYIRMKSRKKIRLKLSDCVFFIGLWVWSFTHTNSISLSL